MLYPHSRRPPLCREQEAPVADPQPPYIYSHRKFLQLAGIHPLKRLTSPLPFKTHQLKTKTVRYPPLSPLFLLLAYLYQFIRSFHNILYIVFFENVTLLWELMLFFLAFFSSGVLQCSCLTCVPYVLLHFGLTHLSLFQSKFSVCVTLKQIAGIVAIPSYAAGGRFTPRCCRRRCQYCQWDTGTS